jgi:hypothetical protein
MHYPDNPDIGLLLLLATMTLFAILVVTIQWMPWGW